MKRTGFTRKPNAGLERVPMKRTHKRSRPATGIDAKYLAACRGEPCYLRIPGICRLLDPDETCVPAHSNEQGHGKGMGLTARHFYTVPGCAACHAWLDQGKAAREVKFAAWRGAFAIWGPIRSRKLEMKNV
jgi:hypothetical protein